MIRFERILCPIDLDLSQASDEALRYALALVRAYGAQLYVSYCAEGIEPDNASALKATCGELEEVFQTSLARYGGGGSAPAWECAVTGGDTPAEAITREASARQIDLIVMGSRRRPLRAALLGSTAETVCRTAPCPVLVAHPQERGWVGMSGGEISLKRVLVGVDFSASAQLALAYGLSLAQQYQAELRLLHALPQPDENEAEISWAQGSAEGAYHEAARRLQQSVPADAYLWCDVKHIVRWGKPYRELLAYATEQSVDLVVIGAHGAGFGAQTLFGSNTDRVLRQAPCPVLVARPVEASS